MGTLLLHLFTTMVATLQDIVLAEGARSVDVQPLVYAGTVKMMTTGKLPKLSSIIISRKAYATLLKLP